VRIEILLGTLHCEPFASEIRSHLGTKMKSLKLVICASFNTVYKRNPREVGLSEIRMRNWLRRRTVEKMVLDGFSTVFSS
jgi:hypothetical protein